LKGTDAGGAARTKAAAAAAQAIKQAPEFGTNVAAEDSAAQLMHDAQRGKFQYVNDFAQSLNTGPVKLSFKDAPKTQEDEAQVPALHRRAWCVVRGAWCAAHGAWCVVRDVWCTSYQPSHPVQERALSMIQRSVLMGSLAVLASGVIGWQITKWYMGVKNTKVSCRLAIALTAGTPGRGVAWYSGAAARWRGGAVAWCGGVWRGVARPLGPPWLLLPPRQEFSERLTRNLTLTRTLTLTLTLTHTHPKAGGGHVPHTLVYRQGGA